MWFASNYYLLFSIRRRLTWCALVTGVQTCALPIYAPQDDRRFPDLPHHSIQLGTIQRKQMPPVEDARKHRRLRESLSHRLDYRCSKPFAVDAVDDEVRFLRACTPQQIDPTAVRSDERRGGKELGRSVRVWWWPYH